MHVNECFLFNFNQCLCRFMAKKSNIQFLFFNDTTKNLHFFYRNYYCYCTFIVFFYTVNHRKLDFNFFLVTILTSVNFRSDKNKVFSESTV